MQVLLQLLLITAVILRRVSMRITFTEVTLRVARTIIRVYSC